MKHSKSLAVAMIIALFGNLYGAKIAVYNHTKEAIKVKIKINNAADETVTIQPIERYKLDQAIGSVKEISINGKDYEVDDGEYVSYDIDANGDFVLVCNKFGYPKPFSFLMISDTHTIGATEKEMEDWEKEQKKEGKQIKNSDKNSLKKHKELSDRIQNFITKNSDQENIRSLIVSGDLVWWNENQSVECKAFKTLYYEPISALLKKKGGKFFACGGNHDQYGKDGHFSPIMDFIKDKFGNFFYTFNIHGVHFIVLGMCPSPEPKELGLLGNFSELIDRDGGSLNYLENDLKSVPNNIPLFIIMHEGTNKHSPWWDDDIKEHIGYVHPCWSGEKKDEETDKTVSEVKNRFYKALANHKVLGVLCGHTHKQEEKQTSNHKYAEIVIGSKKNPAFFSIDPVAGVIASLRSVSKDGSLVSFS